MIQTEEIRAMLEAATPGPWMWDMRTGSQSCMLVTAHSGRYYIMGFERWGFHNACPVFQTYKTYHGPVSKRGSTDLVRADKLAKPIPGMEHHIGFDEYIDHPDAKLIAKAPEIIAHLLTENAALRARAEAGEVMRPADEWHEDHGPALWWNYPEDDEPFVGSPLWSDWKDRPFEPTHFTRITAREPEPVVEKEATP